MSVASLFLEKKRRRVERIFVFVAGLFAATVSAEKDVELVIATTHPPTLPWVYLLRDEFIPSFNRRIYELEPSTKLRWTSAWGTLYRWHDSLAGVEIGLSDIGWVGSVWEASRLPLPNMTYSLPFITDDLVVLLEVVNELHDEIPEMKQGWERCNVKFLGATGVDTYHLLTKFPVKSFEDLRDKKILAPGTARIWLKGSGATAVNGALTTYYTQIKTGMADGALTILTGAYPFRLHEVAPYLTLVGVGAQSVGGLVVNLDKWNLMPMAWRAIFQELAREYSRRSAELALEKAEQALRALISEGAIVSKLSAREKKVWINSLPPLGENWVRRNEEKGLPAKRVVENLMNGLRARGVEPMRAWDLELK